jgi:hypothetical protein
VPGGGFQNIMRTVMPNGQKTVRLSLPYRKLNVKTLISLAPPAHKDVLG